MSAVEKFPTLLSDAEEESSAVAPCFSHEGINVSCLFGGCTEAVQHGFPFDPTAASVFDCATVYTGGIARADLFGLL